MSIMTTLSSVWHYWKTKTVNGRDKIFICSLILLHQIIIIKKHLSLNLKSPHFCNQIGLEFWFHYKLCVSILVIGLPFWPDPSMKDNRLLPYKGTGERFLHNSESLRFGRQWILKIKNLYLKCPLIVSSPKQPNRLWFDDKNLQVSRLSISQLLPRYTNHTEYFPCL